MATVVVTFAFLTDAQSFTGTAGANSVLSYDAVDGNPAGCLKSEITGKSHSNANNWARTLTYETMGVPAGSTVTGITSASMQSRCTLFTTGASSTAGNVTLVDGVTTVALAAARTFTATDVSFVTSTGTNATGLSKASSNSVTITINNTIATGSSNSADLVLLQDQLTFTITFNPVGAQAALTGAAGLSVNSSHTPAGAAALTGAASLVAPVTHTPTVGPARTNWVRNNTNVGAVAGSPGTLPTGWTQFNGGISGVTLSVAAIGTDATGFPYIDLTISGTPGSTGAFYLWPDTTKFIPAAQGQVWVMASGVSATNLTNFGFQIGWQEENSSGGDLAENDTTISPTTTVALFSTTGTLGNAATAFIAPQYRFTLTSGQAVSATVRLQQMQLEQGSVATATILTSGSVVTVDGVQLTGAASLVAGAIPKQFIGATLTGAASIVAGTTQFLVASALHAAAGILVGTATHTPVGAAALTGTANLVTSPLRETFGVAALGAAGALVALGIATRPAVAVLAGEGIVSLAGVVPPLSPALRITQDGGFRIIESGDPRVLEHSVWDASAVLSGSATLSVGTVLRETGIVILPGAASLIVDAAHTVFGSAALLSAAGLVSVAARVPTLSAALAGEALLSAVVAHTPTAEITFTGIANLAAVAVARSLAAAALSGTSFIALDTTHAPSAAAALVAAGTLGIDVTHTPLGTAALTGAAFLVSQSIIPVSGNTAVFAGAGAFVGDVNQHPEGTASLRGNASLLSDTTQALLGSASFAAGGALLVRPVIITTDAAVFSGTTTLLVDLLHPNSGSASLVGVGNFVGAGAPIHAGSASLTGSAALVLQPRLLVSSAARLSGIADLAVATIEKLSATVLLAGSGDLRSSLIEYAQTGAALGAEAVLVALGARLLPTGAAFAGSALIHVFARTLLPLMPARDYTNLVPHWSYIIDIPELQYLEVVPVIEFVDVTTRKIFTVKAPTASYVIVVPVRGS